MKLFLASLAAVGLSSAVTCQVHQYYSPNSGTCKTAATLGEYCNVVVACAENHICQANKCIFTGVPGAVVDDKTAFLGDACGSGKTCVPGLSCGSGFVEPSDGLKPANTACVKHHECSSKVCNQGACTAGDQMFLVMRVKSEMDGTECDGSQKGKPVPLHCCDSNVVVSPYFPFDCISNDYPEPYEAWGGAFCDLESGGMYFTSGMTTNGCEPATGHSFFMPRGGCLVGGEYLNDQYYMVVPDTDLFDTCDLHKCPGQQLNKLGECEPIPGAVAVGGQCSSHADCSTKACNQGKCANGNKHLFMQKSKTQVAGTECGGEMGDVVPLSCCDSDAEMYTEVPKTCIDNGMGGKEGWLCSPDGGLFFYSEFPGSGNCELGTEKAKYAMPRGSCIIGGSYLDDQFYMVIPDSQTYVCDYGSCSGATTLGPFGTCIGACGANLGSAGNGGEVVLFVTVSSEDGSPVGIDFDALSEAAVVDNVQMFMWAKVSKSHWEGRLGFQNSTYLANHLALNSKVYSVANDDRITISTETYGHAGAVGDDVRNMLRELGWKSHEFEATGYIRHPARAEGTLSEKPQTCISAKIIANMDAVPDWNEWKAGWQDLVEPSSTRSDIHSAFWGFDHVSKHINFIECFSGDGAASQAKVAADVMARRVHHSASYGNRYTFGMTNAKTSANFALYAPYMQNDYVYSAGPSAGYIVNPNFLDFGEPMCYGPNGECRAQFANRAFEYVTSGSFQGTPFAYTILVSLLAEDKLNFKYIAVDHGGQGDIYSEVGYSVTQDPEPKRGGLFRHDLSSDVVLMSWMEHPVGASVLNVYDVKYGKIHSVLTYSGPNAGNNFGLQMKGTNDLTEVTMPSVHPSFQDVDFSPTALTGRKFSSTAGGSPYEMTFNDETTFTEVLDGMSSVKSVANNGMWRKDISPDVIQIGWSDATTTGASVVMVINLADMKFYSMAAFIHADFFAGGDPHGLLGTEIFELHHVTEM